MMINHLITSSPTPGCEHWGYKYLNCVWVYLNAQNRKKRAKVAWNLLYVCNYREKGGRGEYHTHRTLSHMRKDTMLVYINAFWTGEPAGNEATFGYTLKCFTAYW